MTQAGLGHFSDVVGTNINTPSTSMFSLFRDNAAIGLGAYFAKMSDGTIESITAASAIGGAGTLNFISKFTPDGTHISNSQLFDNSVSVGLGTTMPIAVAKLQVNSTTQGVLLPRMTTVERDAIVTGLTSNGLLVFNTSTAKFNFWNNTLGAWESIDTSTGGDVSGNGTTDRVVKWTDGPNSVAGDGSWEFNVNTIRPVTSGSDIGDATHRVATIFMSSTINYASTLDFISGLTTTASLDTLGNLTLLANLKLRNPADTFSYSIVSDAIVANRSITLPLLTGNDVMVTEAFAQALTNKTGYNGLVITANTGVVTTGTWQGTKIALDFGGTNSDLSVGGLLGDTLYADTPTTFVRLPGNTTTTKKFLRQTGTGVVSAAPTWDTVTAADIVTGFTLGSVIFAGAAGVLSQDNANFFWDDTNNRLGIGNAAPTTTLDVTGNVNITGKLTVSGAIDPTMVLLSGADKRFGATDAGAVYLAPFTDATSGVQVRKADNVTVVFNVDTSNSRVGIGTVTPSDTLQVVGTVDVSGHTAIGANASVGVASTLVIDDNYTIAGTTLNVIHRWTGGGAVGTQLPFLVQYVGSGAGVPTRVTLAELILVSNTGGDPTTLEGLRVNDVGNAGTTTSRAINIFAQTGSTTNYGLSSLAVNNYVAGLRINSSEATALYPLHVTADNAERAVEIFQSNVAGFGLRIKPGVDTLNYALLIRNAADGANRHRFFGSGDAYLAETAGNVGFGNSAPTEKVDVTGNVLVSGVVSHALGTSAAPSITFTGNLDTGIFSSSANIIDITSVGIRTFRFFPFGSAFMDAIDMQGVWRTARTTGGAGFNAVLNGGAGVTAGVGGHAIMQGGTGAGGSIVGKIQFQESVATPGAGVVLGEFSGIVPLVDNHTSLFLLEQTGGVDTLRRVQWKNPGAAGVLLLATDKVLVLV